jgi:uncharacterized protein
MRLQRLHRSLRIALLVLLACLVFPLQARELATDPDEMLVVELATVGVESRTGMPVVLLREPVSGDVVPIFTGVDEARAILMALHEVPTPRPMTHDLMRDLVAAVDAVVVRVLVDDFAGGVYFGMLELQLAGQEELILVDTRPSDGLALALRTGAAILVAPKVLDAGRGMQFEGLGEDEVVTAVGITVVRATAELREAMELPDRPGVLVSRATGPAAAAGMRPGSLIVEVNGETPHAPMSFLELVRRTPEGEEAQIVYWQEGEEHAIGVATDVPPPAPASPAPEGVVEL